MPDRQPTKSGSDAIELAPTSVSLSPNFESNAIDGGSIDVEFEQDTSQHKERFRTRWRANDSSRYREKQTFVHWAAGPKAGAGTLSSEANRLRSSPNSGILLHVMCRMFETERTSRKLISAVALFACLFAQISLAGYVCPSLSESARGAVSDQAKTPCTELDPQQPSLCHEHCKDQAGVDHVQFPGVPSSMGMAHVLVVPQFDVHQSILSASCSGPDPTRVTKPPSSILFCVFRT
jgi:hypothetical protein